MKYVLSGKEIRQGLQEPIAPMSYITSFRNDLFLKSEYEGERPVFCPSEPELSYHDYVIWGQD